MQGLRERGAGGNVKPPLKADAVIESSAIAVDLRSRRTADRGSVQIAQLALWLALLFAMVLMSACGKSVPAVPALAPGDVIVAFGDSLTYGTGASADETYPAILSQLLGRDVIGRGVPGERTDGGLQRLPAVLDEFRPKLLLLCLGGNDMLRKVSPDITEANLRRMVEMARARGTSVVLIAVPAPALFGGSAKFYRRVADDLGVPLENSIVNEVLRDNALKSDAIHPNAQGYRRIAEAIAALLRDSGAI